MGLDPRQAVALWERCGDLHPQERALHLLLAGPEPAELGALARLPIGERDRRLLALLRDWVGDAITALDLCPGCGERVELQLSVAALLDQAPPPGPTLLSLDDLTVRFRPLNTEDLLALRGLREVARGAELLRRRVVVEARRGEEAVVADALSAEEQEALSLALEAADPLSEIQLEAACPACERRWFTLLEPVEHLWAQLSREARQALHEVHALASAYGWTEDQVLALSPQRRRWYVERVGA